MRARVPHRGFALAEGAALLVVAAFVVAFILVIGNEQRRQGRLGEDIGKLQRIGSLTQQYAADNAGKFWAFSWRKGQSLSQYPELNNAPDDLRAAVFQATDILRRRAGRTDFQPPVSWMAPVQHSHLVLADYDGKVPDEAMISAADAHRLRWSRDPLGFDQGQYQPAPSNPGPGSNDAKRWPYAASFHLPTCFYDKSGLGNRAYQGQVHNQYYVPTNVVFAGQTVSDVAYPALKVHLHDPQARHFSNPEPYATHDFARLPLLFVDGSVATRASTESNPGWNPNAPTSLAASVFYYVPDTWEPPTVSGQPSELVTGRFRWTRGFLDGRDFGGPEVCTGQPGCP